MADLKRGVPILILVARQPTILLIANWKIGNSKRLFDVYYGEMTHQLKSIPFIPLFLIVCINVLHARLYQMPLMNLEKHLILLRMYWRQKHDKYYEL